MCKRACGHVRASACMCSTHLRLTGLGKGVGSIETHEHSARPLMLPPSFLFSKPEVRGKRLVREKEIGKYARLCVCIAVSVDKRCRQRGGGVGERRDRYMQTQVKRMIQGAEGSMQAYLSHSRSLALSRSRSLSLALPPSMQAYLSHSLARSRSLALPLSPSLSVCCASFPRHSHTGWERS